MYNISQGVFYNGVQSVSPAGSGDSSNGLSIDPVSGDNVLGNNVGDAAKPARLLSDREIETDDPGGGGPHFSIDLKSTINNIITRLLATRILMTGGNFTNPFIRLDSGDFGSSSIVLQSGDNAQSALDVNTGLGGFATIRVNSDSESFTITADGSGFITFNASGIDIWRVNLTTFFTQFGPTLTTFNGATLQVSGTFTSRAPITNQSSGTLTLVRTTDSGRVISNTNGTGLLTVNLPSMFATTFAGFYIWVIVNDADGIRVTAPAGATINLSGVVSASGGSIQSTLVGAAIQLFCIDPARWVATSITGTWSI